MMIRMTLKLMLDSLLSSFFFVSLTCGLCPEFFSTICAWSVISTLYVLLPYVLHFNILLL